MLLKQIPQTRCPWVIPGNTLYEAYHDTEWGIPVHEDSKHFELLTLESAQSGLSWITILKKREGYRQAFADFDPKIVASFTEDQIEALLYNENIVRNIRKIRSTICNARAFLLVQEVFGSFDRYVWGFVQHKSKKTVWATIDDIPKQTQDSQDLCQDLKKRGFSFLGPVTLYSYMQAAGLVCDHTKECYRNHI